MAPQQAPDAEAASDTSGRKPSSPGRRARPSSAGGPGHHPEVL